MAGNWPRPAPAPSQRVGLFILRSPRLREVRLIFDVPSASPFALRTASSLLVDRPDEVPPVRRVVPRFANPALQMRDRAAKIQRQLLQGRHICWARRVVKSKWGKGNQARHKDLPMDDALFIYRNSSGPRFCDPAAQQIRGGTEVIVYVNGVLCAMDREAKITMPVSRWKLAEIGLGCFLAALKGKRATPRVLEAKGKRANPRSVESKGKRAAHRSLEARPVPESPPETFPACPPETIPAPPRQVTEQENSETQWERLIQEMRDLSRR